MAIEILKRGVIPEKEQTFEVHCGHCKSRLKFLSADARREVIPGGYNQMERPYVKYTITCPVCEFATYVTSDK
jgi:hypothetical protein